MTETVLIIPDQHAHPDYNNNRADWMGQFIKDLKPDVVVNMGDAADLASLSTFDKGKASFAARNYERDIVAHLDFQERMWAPIKRSKRKMPYRVVLEGNHEYRIKRATELSPELAGDRFGLSFKNLDFNRYYHEVVEYESGTPGIWTYKDVAFAHYFISGIMGRPLSGEHMAASLIKKNYMSSVAAHSHTADFAIRTDTYGHHRAGLVVGVYQDYESPWAGRVNKLWWRGAVVLRDFADGMFNPEFVPLERLRREYA